METEYIVYDEITQHYYEQRMRLTQKILCCAFTSTVLFITVGITVIFNK